MSIVSLIADTREAVAGDPANAQAVFAAQGTLVGVTEVDVHTVAHTFKVDEPPAMLWAHTLPLSIPILLAGQ